MARERKKPILSRLKENAVTIQYGKRLIMEEVEEVVFCDENRVVLKGSFSMEVLGKGLVLAELGNHNMEVKGKICSVRFGDGE